MLDLRFADVDSEQELGQIHLLHELMAPILAAFTSDDETRMPVDRLARHTTKAKADMLSLFVSKIDLLEQRSYKRSNCFSMLRKLWWYPSWSALPVHIYL